MYLELILPNHQWYIKYDTSTLTLTSEATGPRRPKG